MTEASPLPYGQQSPRAALERLNAMAETFRRRGRRHGDAAPLEEASPIAEAALDPP